MAGFRRQDMYEEDPTGKTIREIYDDIDRRIEERKEDEEFPFDIEFETDFWVEDSNELLTELGIDSKFNLEGVPLDKLDRIYKYYEPRSQEMNDEAMYFDVDPIPHYYSKNGSFTSELHKLGLELGHAGVVGKYYRLLADINFARGYWQGKVEKSFDEKNDEILIEVSKEIKLYDPLVADEELAMAINNCYSTKQVDNEQKPAKK